MTKYTSFFKKNLCANWFKLEKMKLGYNFIYFSTLENNGEYEPQRIRRKRRISSKSEEKSLIYARAWKIERTWSHFNDQLSIFKK